MHSQATFPNQVKFEFGKVAWGWAKTSLRKWLQQIAPTQRAGVAFSSHGLKPLSQANIYLELEQLLGNHSPSTLNQ
jgi:hypothetical protein